MAEPVPGESLYRISTPTEIAVSPDGERVAFVVTERDGEEETNRSSLFVVPTDGSRAPHRLARASEASQPTWSPDGDRLGFVAARDRDIDRSIGHPPEERDGDESEESEAEASEESTDGEDTEEDDAGGNGEGSDEPKPQVWLFDLARGGDAIQVTDREEGVREFDWGPEGERVVVSARDPTDEQQEQLDQRREEGPIEIERLQHKSEAGGWLDSVRSYLFVVDIERGESRRLDDAYGGGAMEPISGLQPAWSPDGDRIAFVSNRTERPDNSAVMDVYTVAPSGGEAERLTDGSVTAGDLEWSPDGSRLAFASWDPENMYIPTEAYVLGRDGEYESVSASLDRTLSWLGSPVWLDDGTLLAGVADGGQVRPYTLDADADDPEPHLDTLGRERSVRLLDSASDRVVCSVDHPETGHDLYALSRSDLDASFDEAAVRLTTLNETFIEEQPTAEFHRVTAEHDDAEGDGDPVTVESMVYTPPEFDPSDPEPRPTILWPHGGPMSYDDPAFRFTNAYFTSRGYVVLRPNYRGSTSYGRAFCETLRGRWGSVEIIDQLAALDDLVERGWADPDRLFATGFSYGGISTGFLVTETDRFAAAAPEHGIYDRRSSFGTDDTHVTTSNDLGVPWEAPETYEANSSLTDVDQVETPLLITAGENDWRCPPTQAEQLYVSVRKQGVPAKLVIYQGEGHSAGDPDNAIHRVETLAAWFEKFDPTTDPET
jgi:dipeptidyl aminopeptidase/acylaminoacyl peptidase